jgi:two-component system chemotaxis response regulator CheY
MTNSNAKVLIVDDSNVMRRVIRGILKDLQLQDDNIAEAADGAEAVKMAAAGNFHLILMDWNMPNMLGIDAVKAIRGTGNKTPILMVTTEGERANIVAAIQAGANNYLVKPFNADDLRAKAEALISG